MNTLRPKISLLLVALLTTIISFAFAQAGVNKGQTDGTFIEIEQGDYAYFRIKTKTDEDSFFILRPDKTVQSFIDNGAKLKGQKVRVFWEERNENIPEAGGKQLIKVVTRVEQQK